MRLYKIKLLSMVIFCFLGVVFTVQGFCEEPGEPIIAKKNIDRTVDPIIMQGDLLNKMIGKPISNLRVYAYNKGVFEPIRFQIDEMSKDGDWIFPEGKIINTELANGTFDTQDELVFMADDTGDRVKESAWVKGYTSGEEIEIVDPLTGKKGWCYLLYFASSPPARSSLPDYFTFDYETNYEESPNRKVRDIITDDGRRTTFYEWFSIPVSAGGNDTSFVDRLKIRVPIKLLFGGVTLRFNEEKLKSDTLAYKRGPVRVIKRVEQYVSVGKLKVSRAVTDIAQYRATATCPSVFQIPVKLNTITTSAHLCIGTDYNENAMGATIYNSSNPKGMKVDGRMDENEKNIDHTFDNWRLITGPCGTFMTRTIFPKEFNEIDLEKYSTIEMNYIDDITHKDPPEKYPGCIGYLWQDWNVGNVPKGKYTIFLDFYWIPNYKPGDETYYVNYLDSPLKVRVGGKEKKNRSMVVPNITKKYRGSIGWE